MIDDFITNLSKTFKENRVTSTFTRPGHSGNGAGLAKELLFNIGENNRSGPDLITGDRGDEFKVSNEDSACNITLINVAPHKNLIDPDPVKGRKRAATRALAETFAIQDEMVDNRKNFYMDVKMGKVTSLGGVEFSLSHDEDNLFLHAADDKVASWGFTVLKERFRVKLGGINGKGGLVHTSVKSFLVNTATNKFDHVWVKSTSFDGFKTDDIPSLICDGTISLSFKAHTLDIGKKSLKIRDHGTGFRIHPRNIGRLYETGIAIDMG